MLQSDEQFTQEAALASASKELAHTALQEFRIEVRRVGDTLPYFDWRIMLGKALLAEWEADDPKDTHCVSAGEAAERAYNYYLDHCGRFMNDLLSGHTQP
jgi:hypothetical protein